jgi:hypothetical protein
VEDGYFMDKDIVFANTSTLKSIGGGGLGEVYN